MQAIQNDLASIANDYLQHQVDTNIVLRPWDRSDCSLADAAAAVLDLHDEAVEDLDRFARSLIDSATDEQRARVSRHADQVRFMQTGFGLFHIHADRYARLTTVEDAVAHRLTLSPRPVSRRERADHAGTDGRRALNASHSRFNG